MIPELLGNLLLKAYFLSGQCWGGGILTQDSTCLFFINWIKDIKKGLGNYTKKPEQYLQAFQQLSCVYDSMEGSYVAFESKFNFFGKIRGLREGYWNRKQLLYGRGWKVTKAGKSWNIPKGSQAVPLTEPTLNAAREKDEWDRHHLIYCVVEGLRKAQVKPFNYTQLATVIQGEKEPPVTFLRRLQEDLTNTLILSQGHRWQNHS